MSATLMLKTASQTTTEELKYWFNKENRKSIK